MKYINFRALVLLMLLVLSQQLSANDPNSAYSSMPAVDCVINPYRVVDISSPVAGVIDQVYVERSQQVSAGQVIAELEASVERANVELARYRANVESEIGVGTVNINFDQLRKQRVESLLEEQNISRENADQIEREVQLSRWKLKQAKELSNIRQLELRKAEEQLRQKSIPAPFDGFVLDTFKYRGEYVEDQAILRLAQLDPLVVEAIVPMENFGSIIPGMEAEVMPEVLLKEKIKGEVIAVDRIGDTASNTFGVKLSMPNPDNRIPAGLKCIVKFLAATPEQLARQEAVEEPPNVAGREPSNGFIDRAVKENQPEARAVKVSTSVQAESSELFNAISEAMAANASESASVKTGDPLSAEIQQQVASLSGPVELEVPSSTEKTPTSFMVMIEQPESKAATEDLVDQLRNAGMNDYLVINYGVRKGYISLGVFKSRAFAENRQQQLDQLGFNSFTVERYK